MIEFTIFIKPQPMRHPDPRISVLGGVGGRPRTIPVRLSGHVAVHKLLGAIRKHLFLAFRPTKADAEYRADLLRAMRRHVPAVPMVGPVRLDAYFVFKYRTGDSKEFRSALTQPKDTYPDWDNCSKALCDAIEEAGFVGDDSQISTAFICKRWGERDLIHVVLRPDDGGKPAPNLFDAAANT